MTPATEKLILRDLREVKTLLRKREEVWLPERVVIEKYDLESKTLWAYRKENKVKWRSLKSGKKIQYLKESIDNLFQ